MRNLTSTSSQIGFLISRCSASLMGLIAVLSFSTSTLCQAAEGDMTLSVPMLDSTVTIKTEAKYAGAISSVIFRGKEFIDSHDHGRLLQSASSFDHYGECFNPTEAGSVDDYQKNSTASVLKAARMEGNQLWTKVDMGFWLSPGDSYPNGCGGNQSIKKAVNTTLASGHILEKHITVGLPGFPNVIKHEVAFYVPGNYSTGTFEASTGYVPKEFSRALYFDPVHNSEIDPGNKQGEQQFPVILSTPNKLFAMGVYSPQLPQNGAGYGRFTFPDVNKWNCVFRESNITPKPYRFQCMVVLGTLNEVENTIRQLDLNNRNPKK